MGEIAALLTSLGYLCAVFGGMGVVTLALLAFGYRVLATSLRSHRIDVTQARALQQAAAPLGLRPTGPSTLAGAYRGVPMVVTRNHAILEVSTQAPEGFARVRDFDSDGVPDPVVHTHDEAPWLASQRVFDAFAALDPSVTVRLHDRRLALAAVGVDTLPQLLDGVAGLVSLFDALAATPPPRLALDEVRPSTRALLTARLDPVPADHRDALRRLCDDPEPTVRLEAALRLGHQPTLADLYDDPSLDGPRRARLREALAVEGAERIVAAQLAQAPVDLDTIAHLAARYPSGACRAGLRQALAGSRVLWERPTDAPEVQRLALHVAEALAPDPTPDTLLVLVPLLRKGHATRVRTLVCEALDRGEATPALVEALRTIRPEAGPTADQAIARFFGQQGHQGGGLALADPTPAQGGLALATPPRKTPEG